MDRRRTPSFIYIDYFSTRCYIVASISGYGMFVLPFLITVELLPPEKKTLVSMMINFPFVIGETLMCLIAMATKDYRTMHLAGYIPLVGLFPLWFLIPESPRWLLAKGRVEEAKQVVNYGARWTKSKITKGGLYEGEDCADGEELVSSDAGPVEHIEVGFIDLLKSRTLLVRLLVN